MRVNLIGATVFMNDYARKATDDRWHNPEVDSDGERLASHADLLAEFAGRSCYQSWSKPNPKTSSNVGYLDHILEVGHYSVLEHASATFYITGVSRSLTHAPPPPVVLPALAALRKRGSPG